MLLKIQEHSPPGFWAAWAVASWCKAKPAGVWSVNAAKALAWRAWLLRVTPVHAEQTESASRAAVKLDHTALCQRFQQQEVRATRRNSFLWMRVPTRNTTTSQCGSLSRAAPSSGSWAQTQPPLSVCRGAAVTRASSVRRSNFLSVLTPGALKS